MRAADRVGVFVVAAIAGLAACGGGGGGGTATPATPVASATPAASALLLFPLSSAVASPPPGVLGIQDLTMSFTDAGASQYVLALEPGFQGTFTAKPTSACTVAAGVSNAITSPISVTAVGGHANGPQAVFQISSVAAGTCALKFNDGTTTNSAEILITVTQSVGNVN